MITTSSYIYNNHLLKKNIKIPYFFTQTLIWKMTPANIKLRGCFDSLFK